MKFILNYLVSIPLRLLIIAVEAIRLIARLILLPFACMFLPMTVNGKPFKWFK